MLHFMPERELSAKGRELVDFDIASIRQVVAAAHAATPEAWLVATDRYELNGRVLRDSTAPRLLGYSPAEQTLYTTDGCNSCSHALRVDLFSLSPEALRAFAKESSVEIALLERFVEVLTTPGPS